MSVEFLDISRFNTEIVNADNLVLVDFFASWCGPCQMMAPVLEEISDECDFVDVYKIDADEAPELCQEYDVEFLPTMIIFKNGEEIERFMGLTGKSQIKNALRSYREDDFS